MTRQFKILLLTFILNLALLAVQVEALPVVGRPPHEILTSNQERVQHYKALRNAYQQRINQRNVIPTLADFTNIIKALAVIAKDYEDLTASPYYESNSELQALAAALKDFGTTLTKEYKREMGKAPWLVTGAAFLGKMLYRHKFKIFRDLKPEEYFT